MARFYNRKSVLPTLGDIKFFEKELDLVLPEDYKQHLLKYNGGTPTSACYFVTKKGREIEFESFLSFKTKKKNTLLKKHLEFDKDLLPSKYLTIGYIVGGHIAIRLVGKKYGAIYKFHSDVKLKKIADSFTELIKGLQNEIIFGRHPQGMVYEDYEKLLKADNLKLPIAYRNFICNTNGGVPTPNTFVAETGKVYQIKSFFCMEEEPIYYDINGFDLYSSKIVLKTYRDEEGVLPANFYPFANGDNSLAYCIQMNKKGFGSVYLLNLEEAKPKPEFICHSFDYFLKNIEEVS